MKKLFVPLVVLLLVGAALWAQDEETVKKQLAGLSGIHVLVDVTPDKLSSLLPVSTIQTDVEVKLGIARIPVLTEVEWIKDRKAAMLYVRVVGRYSNSNQIWALAAVAECCQSAILTRDKSIDAFAVT